MQQVHVEGLVHGNMIKEDAVSIMDLTNSIFKMEALSKEARTSPRSLLIPECTFETTLTFGISSLKRFYGYLSVQLYFTLTRTEP